MTTETLYDALETCLQAIEQGADVEFCLARFPAQAEELRPILETALQARSVAVAEVPAAALRRGKARFLQAAAEMREQASVPASSRRWNLGRVLGLSLVSLAMMLFLLITGWAGLTRAAAGSLPGDGLYPVKRSWEGIRLFIAAPNLRLELETEFEQERVREINQLYRVGRAEQVEFQGLVTAKNDTLWNISGVLVMVTDQTLLDGEILPGARVQVWGRTGKGIISAEQIRLLTSPISTQTPSPSSTSQPAHPLTPSATAANAIRLANCNFPAKCFATTCSHFPPKSLSPLRPPHPPAIGMEITMTIVTTIAMIMITIMTTMMTKNYVHCAFFISMTAEFVIKIYPRACSGAFFY